jgi:hypothetical protein
LAVAFRERGRSESAFRWERCRRIGSLRRHFGKTHPKQRAQKGDNPSDNDPTKQFYFIGSYAGEPVVGVLIGFETPKKKVGKREKMGQSRIG